VGVQEKTDDADPAKHCVETKVAPAGRPDGGSKVTALQPPAPVALTMKRTMEPAVTVCGPGTDNVGGAITVKVTIEVTTWEGEP
jgi:hypothetical protein